MTSSPPKKPATQPAVTQNNPPPATQTQPQGSGLLGNIASTAAGVAIGNLIFLSLQN